MTKLAVIAPLYGKYGGTGRVTTEVIERYAKDGNEIHVYCIDYDDRLTTKSYIKKVKKVPVLKIQGLLTILSFTIMSTLLVRKKDYDIVYTAGDFHFFPDIITVHTLRRVMRKQRNEKKVFERLTIFKSLILRCKSTILWLLELPEQWILSNSNVKLISVSYDVEMELINNHISGNRIKTIENGVDIQEYNPNNITKHRSDIREKFGFSEKDLIILFVGSDWDGKGLLELFKAVASMEDCYKLLIIGNGNRKKYFEHAKRLNCENKITFGGFQKESNKLFAACDIFVFPSLYETFGLVVLEAMATGLPVISTPVNGVKRFLKDRYNGLLCEPSSESIKHKIEFLMMNPSLRAQLIQNGLKTAEEYSWEKVYIKYKAFFDSYVRDCQHKKV